jgi:hypothetical protein
MRPGTELETRYDVRGMEGLFWLGADRSTLGREPPERKEGQRERSSGRDVPDAEEGDR